MRGATIKIKKTEKYKLIYTSVTYKFMPQSQNIQIHATITAHTN